MHHPLTRQQTRDSLRSWWSDRNPVGPNINLHAATKPLMRFMYRRDVLALIDKNRGIPLTNEDMEIYSSYLAYKYVSASTKRAILMELQMRVKSESDACAVADSFLVYLLDEFLSSPDIEMRKSMCRLLAVLTQHQAAVLPLLRGNPCPQLVSLLKGSDIGVVADATEALCSIAKCPEGAQAVVDSNVFDCLAALLVSANEEIRKWPCDLLAELARHETIAMAVAGSLVSLLRAGEFVVLRHAAKILERIATSSDGAQAVVDGEIGSRVSELLESPDVWARQWTCSMLDEVAGSENAALAALCIISCPHLVSLLRDQYSDVISMAAKVLYHITASPDGAQAALDANVLECLPPLLESPDPEVCGWTRNLLQRLAHHETKMRAAVVGHAVALLWSAKIPVIQAGLRILHDITISPQGATLAVDANVLGRVAHLVESADTEVQTWTWDMMLNLVQNETTARSAVGTLVSLLWRGDSRASQRVADILYQTVNSTKGAQVAMEATVLGLVESAHPAVKRWAWDIVAEFAHDQRPVGSVLNELMLLLDHHKSDIAERATQALYSADGPFGNSSPYWDGNTLALLDEMFASSNPLTRHRTIDIMTQIGQRVYTDKAAARRLVSLIRGDNPIVVEHATKALYYIARSPGGAEAAVDANVLDFVVELLESPNTEVRRWTCELLGELSNQKSTAASVLAATPCAQLVSTLNDGNLGIVERATKALSLIATSPNGAKAADDADVTAYTMKLLTSRHSGVKIWTCELLARLAWHKSTRAAVLREKPCRPLVSLLRDHNRVVIATAVKALSIICRSAEGAVAAVNASMLGCMGALLRSTEAQICRRTFQILGALSRHGNTAPAVLEATHDIQIALFRGRRNIHIRSSAISALAQISENPGANAAVLTTDFLQHCSRMMEFEDLKVQFKICVILRNISRDPLRRA